MLMTRANNTTDTSSPLARCGLCAAARVNPEKASMNIETNPVLETDQVINPEPAPHPQTLVIRRGRGRSGGSTGLDLLIQRARVAGHRIKPLDGDLRSKTLTTLYPVVDDHGDALEDAASSPRSEEPADMKAWLSDELDQMIQGGYSAAADFGGGDRVVQEYEQDLELRDLCDEHHIRLVEVCFLGPEREDFRHVHQIVRSRGLRAHKTLLILNEGVIRQGQTTEGVFSPLIGTPEFQDLVTNGAVPVFMRRLSCMGVLRERGLGFYDAVWGRPDRHGIPASPTLRHMVKTWLRQHEAEHEKAGTREWLP